MLCSFVNELLKEAKLVLPDSFQDPTEDALNSYLHEFKMNTREGHRRLVVLGAFTFNWSTDLSTLLDRPTPIDGRNMATIHSILTKVYKSNKKKP